MLGGSDVAGSIDWNVTVNCPRGVVEGGGDEDVEGDAVVGHRHGGLIVLGAGRDRQHGVAEADPVNWKVLRSRLGSSVSVIVTCWAGAVAVGEFSKSIW